MQIGKGTCNVEYKASPFCDMSLFLHLLKSQKKNFDRSKKSTFFETGFFFITVMSQRKNEKDLQQIKNKLKTMYSVAKSRRPRTKRCDFINPNQFIEKKYHETKKFEKKVRELKAKHLLQHYRIEPLFQMIHLKK